MTIQPPTTNGTRAEHKQSWQEIARQKQAKRDALIPAEWLIEPTKALSVLDVPRTCGVLSEKEIEITEISAEKLVALMTQGSLKSREVTLAFCKRAAIAQQLVSLGETSMGLCPRIVLICARPTASLRSSSRPPFELPRRWTSSSQRQAKLLVRSTVFPSA